ncbi:hypothetical protein ACFPU0_18670 [Pseudomonas sp. GCM10022186]|uniref:hypothetical protein n=1 Tax=Pseudomonas sp. GCM10022186 TaxID=3252650 RepID=UPI0036205A60
MGGTALLPAGLFGSVELTEEEKRVTLLYSLARNQWECRKKEATELLLARHLAREAGLPGFSITDDPQGKITGESMLGLYSMLGYKARYLAIPQAKRAQLDQIEALKRPFDLIGSAKALGIYPEH